MKKEARLLKSAADVVENDLGYIIDHARSEFEKMAGKRILITGGAGFLGYYLVQSLLYWNEHETSGKSIHVTVYDNYMRGVPEWLEELKVNEHLELEKHDITQPLPDSIPDFQYIIHAASIASPIYYRKHPIETMDANVNGLRYLLEYARNQKEQNKTLDGFLFFSTSEIYGDPDPAHIPTPETYRGNVSCTGPRACYDESKRYGETLCTNFSERYNLPITIARPFNNYGPGLKITDRRVIPDFIKDVLSGRNIIMYSDGSPSRTFCYIADAITGYFKVLVNGKAGESYNIGVSEPEISMKELAGLIVSIAKDEMNYKGEVVHQPSSDQNYLVDNPDRRCPIIKKAETDLGYKPTVKLGDGVTRSFLWYMGNQEGAEA